MHSRVATHRRPGPGGQGRRFGHHQLRHRWRTSRRISPRVIGWSAPASGPKRSAFPPIECGRRRFLQRFRVRCMPRSSVRTRRSHIPRKSAGFTHERARLPWTMNHMLPRELPPRTGFHLPRVARSSIRRTACFRLPRSPVCATTARRMCSPFSARSSGSRASFQHSPAPRSKPVPLGRRCVEADGCSA